jgi:hypothetical protein
LGSNARSVFDNFLYTGNGVKLWDAGGVFQSTSAALRGGDAGVFFRGSAASAEFGGFVPIYAPPTWSGGSSISHWINTLNPVPVMNYNIGPGVTRRQYRPYETAALVDLGYQLKGDDPDISAPATLNFGWVEFNTDSDKILTITNLGDSNNLNVTGFTITGPGAARFSTQGALPTGVAPGGSGVLTVRFSPGENAGLTTALLSLTSNDSSGDVALIELSGGGAAPLPTIEGFDYTTDTLLADTGFYAPYSSAGIAPAEIRAAALPRPIPAVLGAVGNHIRLQGADPAEDLIRRFPKRVDSGAVYASMWLRVVDLPDNATGADAVFAFNRNLGLDNNDCGGVRVALGSGPGPNYKIGTSVSASAGAEVGFITAMPMLANTTYYVIVKYEAIAGTNNDRSTVWVNPTAGSLVEGAGAMGSVTHVNNGTELDIEGGAAIDGFRLNQSNTTGAWTLLLDEIRVGESYAEVNPTIVTTGASYWQLY